MPDCFVQRRLVSGSGSLLSRQSVNRTLRLDITSTTGKRAAALKCHTDIVSTNVRETRGWDEILFYPQKGRKADNCYCRIWDESPQGNPFLEKNLKNPTVASKLRMCSVWCQRAVRCMKSLLDQNGLFLVCTFLVLSPKHTSPPATHLSVTTATSRELPEASIIHSSNMLFFSMCRIFLFVLNKTINVLLSHPTVCKAFLCNMTCFF